MVQQSQHAVKTLSLCVAALAAGMFCNAHAADPDTTRVIVAFKPGNAAAMKGVVLCGAGALLGVEVVRDRDLLLALVDGVLSVASVS